jgi:hypothetical protein
MLDMYKVFEHIEMLSIDIFSDSLKQFYPYSTWLRLWGSVSLVESK